VTVLRDGRVVATEPVIGTSAALLARQMVGRDMAPPTREPNVPGEAVLRVEHLSLKDKRGVALLQDIDLTIHAGEIVGLAGVAGNGQRELSEVLSGLQRASAGRFTVNRTDLTNADAAHMARAGVGRIPEDRLQGIIGYMSVALN